MLIKVNKLISSNIQMKSFISVETEALKRNHDQTSDISVPANQVSVNGVTENKNANDHHEYRTKITPDGKIIRVILSEGETSSGVESVSSVDGADDFVAGNISVVTNNVFVEFKNEFAIEYSEGKMLKVSKTVSLHEQNFFNKSEKNSDKVDVRHTKYTPPSYDSYENNYGEKIDRSKYSSNRQQHNNEWSKRDELKDSSNRSDEIESRRLNRSRSSRRRRSDKSRSSERHRSVSRNRRQSSQERRRLNNSRRSRRSRSSSRRRSRSSSRRRSRRSRSLSRRRSRRSRSSSRKRSRRSRSLSRRRSRRSRSSSRRRFRRSRSLNRRSRSLSSISSGSFFFKCPSHERENIEKVDSESSSYSTTETRRERRIHHGRFSPMIRMPTPPPAYYPPAICPIPYWRPVNRIPHGYSRGIPYTIPRRQYPVPREVPRRLSPLIPNRPDFEFSKSVPAKRKSEEDCSKNASNEDPKSETLSEDNARVPPLPEDSARIPPLPEASPVSDDNSSPNARKVRVCDLSEVHKHQCPFPKISLDNLPLVRGENGWPVHISETGETIPYDMSGRRIPIGPNGRYLPLDMAGRLYPHVMTPINEPLPIYLSEDGVLRLPDSRPVPFGPPNKYPVNIDGQFIPIGPDSRPLVPCPDVPTRPPIFVRKEPEAMESNETNEKDDTRSAYSKSTCSDSPNDSQSSPFETQPVENSVPDICIDYILEKIINSIDDESLKKGQELTNQQDKSTRKKFGEDPVVIKIRAALKTLYASNLQPPQPGRFILPEDMFEPPEKKWEMESPLLRHRIELPFLTPGSDEVIVETGKEQEKIIDYTFSSRGNFDVFKETSEDEGEVEIIEDRDDGGEKVKTAECGVQCDFTTDIINEYSTTLTKLRKEVISLQNAYSTLVDMYDKATAPKAF